MVGTCLTGGLVFAALGYASTLKAPKRALGDGKVIEATNVTTTGVPTVVLPAYDVVSYDEYKSILTMQLQEAVITQAEYNALYAEIPPEFQ